MVRAKPKPKRVNKAGAVLEWARSTPAPSEARSSALLTHDEAREVVLQICKMRQEGHPTPSMRQVAQRLAETYPELAERGPFGFVQLRDFVGRHVPGGWGGRV